MFTFLVVFIQTGLGLLFAILLNKKWKTRSFFRATLFLPVIMGITVNALIWKLMFYPMGGPVSSLLKSVFDISSLFFRDPQTAFMWIIFLQIWTYTGFTCVIFLAGLQGIPNEYYEAAKVEGADGWYQFRFITFPLIAQALTVNVLLAVIGALRTYDTMLVTTNGLYNTSTMAFYMFRLAFMSEGGSGRAGGRLGFASSVATILFVFIFLVALITQKFLRKREVEL